MRERCIDATWQIDRGIRLHFVEAQPRLQRDSGQIRGHQLCAVQSGAGSSKFGEKGPHTQTAREEDGVSSNESRGARLVSERKQSCGGGHTNGIRVVHGTRGSDQLRDKGRGVRVGTVVDLTFSQPS